MSKSLSCTSSKKLYLTLLLYVSVLISGSLFFSDMAYAQSKQATWTQFPQIDSSSSPAILEHIDGRIYAAAVGHAGDVLYTSADSPSGWNAWQIINPPTSAGSTNTQPFLADPSTSPALIRNADTFYLLARGKDNNLYITEKAGNGNWSSWQKIISDQSVHGRLSVALTHTGSTWNLHVIYQGANNIVVYRRFDSRFAQLSPAENWSNAFDGTIATDGGNTISAVIRTNDRRLLITRKYRPWSSPWETVTSRLADGPHGQFLDISNMIYFAGAYHIAYSIKYLADDVSGTYGFSLGHTRIHTHLPDDGYYRNIADYTPQANNHPEAALIVYRNKLVMAYKDQQGWVRHARWDNADPTTPWIRSDIVAGGRASRRPALGVLNRRPFLTANDYALDRFGNDLFAAVNGFTTKDLWFINLSRVAFLLDINRQMTIYNSNSDNQQGVCRMQNEPMAPSLVTNIYDDGRPFFTELGYNFWTLPNRLSSHVFKDGARLGCQAGNSSGRFDPPCHQRKYPVIMTRGPIFICSGVWLPVQGDHRRIWEELGHSIQWAMGLSDDNNNLPTSSNATLTGIPLSALLQAFEIFGRGVNNNRACEFGVAPNGRCRGFTGVANNYDVGSRQHSFMYVFPYYYSYDGDQLRQWMREDRDHGVNLLQEKYNWGKQYIFGGLEFRKENEPLITQQIAAKHSSKCLDVAGSGPGDGANVQQNGCHGGDNQRWEVRPTGDGYYQMIAKHSGKCLDVAGSGPGDGANVQQYGCHGGGNQQWKFR